MDKKVILTIIIVVVLSVIAYFGYGYYLESKKLSELSKMRQRELLAREELIAGQIKELNEQKKASDAQLADEKMQLEDLSKLRESSMSDVPDQDQVQTQLNDLDRLRQFQNNH